MTNFFKRVLGIAPTPEPDGKGVIPSRLGLLLGVDKKSGYEPADLGRVRPASGFDDIVDLPCFIDLDWLLDAQVSLRFDQDELWCDVELAAESAPSPKDLKALEGPVSTRLWGSGWSLNLEWEDAEARQAAGIGDDAFANLTVDERPKTVTVVDSAG